MSDLDVPESNPGLEAELLAEGFQQEARDVAECLFRQQSPVLVMLAPGNGTRYDLLITPLMIVDPLGSGDFDQLGVLPATSALVALPMFSACHAFELFGRGYLDPHYVVEKMKISLADAVIVAGFLMAIGQVR